MSDKPKYEFPTDFDSLSWKELALKLSYYLSPALVHSQHAMNSETLHDALGCCNQVSRRVIAERAAPAEDVRAVVDEPVAEYQVRTRSADREGDEGWSPWEKCSELNYADYVRVPVLHGWEYQTRKLYSHPQRPVVMPERKLGSGQYHFTNIGWNTCLDRIAELNK